MNWNLLLDISLKVTIILALTGLLSLALQKASAAARHLLWSLALIGLLLLPFLIEVLPRIQAPIMPAAAEQNYGQPALDESMPLLQVNSLPIVVPEKIAAPIPASLNWQPDWSQLLAFIWGAGVFFCLLRLAVASLRIRRILGRSALVSDVSMFALGQGLSTQLGLQTPVALYVSADLAMPVTAGIKRPVILLPVESADWDAAWLRMVLLHELAHIKRRDCLTQMLANIACAIYWFNPLVWFAAKQLRKERELACDDAVLSLGTRASDYAGYLVAIAKSFELNRATEVVTVGMACSQLESRVRSILNPQVQRGLLTPTKIVVLSMLITAIVLPLASLQATSQDNKKIVAEQEAQALLLKKKAEFQALQSEADSSYQSEITEKLAQEKAALEALEKKAEKEKLSADEAQELARGAGKVAKLEAELNAQAVSEIDAKSKADGAAFAAQRAAIEAIATQVQAQVAQSALLEAQQEAKQKAEENSLTPDNLLQMKIHGVTPEYIEAMRKAGFENLPIRQIVELKIHGIDEAYIKEAQSLSNEKLSARDIIQFKISGLKPEYINAMKQAGFDNLPIRKLSHMRLIGVTPEFAAELKRAGYDNLTVEQLTQMKLQGITPEYIQQTQSSGFGTLSANELIRSKVIGVSADDAKALRALGFDNVAVKDLTQVKLHGVTAEYVKEMRESGFDKLTLGELIRFKIHGVDAAYVRKMRAAGFKNISANQMLEMKIRGIDSILLKN